MTRQRCQEVNQKPIREKINLIFGVPRLAGCHMEPLEINGCF